MKVVASLVVTLIYAAFVALALFLAHAAGEGLKAVGLDTYVMYVVFGAYFLYIWRDNYKQLGKKGR